MDDSVWLWPEGRRGKHLRVWAPDRTECLPAPAGDAPGPIAGRDPRRLVNGAETLALEAALPASLAEWLAERLRRTSRLRLRLAADLPPPWHRCPYEWLTLDGRPLHDRLRVWRRVPRTVEPVPPARPAPIALLDLWPPAEAVYPLADLALPPTEVHRYPGRRWVEALLRTQDPRRYSALCLVVHGSERADAPPFRLPDDTLWVLPTAQPLPPLVVLLACGDCGGHLLDYAATLLECGASAVLAALGALDARDGAALLPCLLQGWLAGERIGDVLEAAQAAVPWQGRGRLCLLGAGALRMHAVPTPAEDVTDRLAARVRAGEDAALRDLLPRLTLDCFLTPAESGRATQRLRELLAIPELGAPAENLRLLHRLQPLVESLPDLSQLWVVPLLAHLAEQHDHARLNDGRRRLEELARAHPEFAGLYADWAKAEYRRGHYAKATAAAVDGLRCVAGDEGSAIRLLGELVLTLIDLNLPELGQALLDLRDRRLDRVGGVFADQEKFKDLDRQGRLALRRGEPRKALACFRHKRAQAPEHREDGRRELAWLLYVAALVGPFPGDTQYAEDCRMLLADQPQPGSGNDAVAVLYLLRALAAWAWRRRDPAAREVLAAWLPKLETGLYGPWDTGPGAFALTYLHLDQRDLAVPFALPAWEEVQVGLEAGRYFLELATFGRLLERPPAEIETWLTHYQHERRAALAALTPDHLPAWLQTARPAMPPNALDLQERQECDLLLAAGPPDWNALGAAHLLPW